MGRQKIIVSIQLIANTAWQTSLIDQDGFVFASRNEGDCEYQDCDKTRDGNDVIPPDQRHYRDICMEIYHLPFPVAYV